MILDIIFIFFILLGVYKGYKKGLIKALFFLLGVIVGCIVGIKFCAITAQYLSKNNFGHSRWLPVLAFFIIFVASIVVASLLAKMIQKSGELLMLGWINRLLGMLLYIFLYTFLCSIIFYFFNKIMLLPSTTISASFFYTHLIKLASILIDCVGNCLPFLKSAYSQIESYFAVAANKIN